MRRLFALLSAAVLMAAMAPVTLAAAPLNDDFANATPITSLPFTDSLDTTEAIVGVDDPPCYEEPTITNTVWYSFTAAATGSVVGSTAGSSYTTRVVVLDNSAFAACSYDGFWIEAEAGHTYSIMIGQATDIGTGGGLLQLSVESYYEPLIAWASISGARIVDGQLVVSGTTTVESGVLVSCELAATAGQQKGKATAGGESGTWPCDAGPWEIVLQAYSGQTWMGAPTFVQVHYSFYDEGGNNLANNVEATLRVPKVPKK